ncbi:uncharacterized protein LOC131425616 [Malaya genurostris]|uniref:uncharacterized protein LOC131425616 n=1 Tax=Malaya genurostris TaxID=325434 RepID=UPI0026F37E5C|nr:uncharacterized protein LOC131425616 [Malaya genurostris]
MRRSSPSYPGVVTSCGSAVSDQYDPDQVDSSLEIRQLKRKHSEERFLPYHYQGTGQSIHKVRKENSFPLHDEDHFHGFGQAFHGPSSEYPNVLAASDGNNNQDHLPQEQHPMGYIYEVSSGQSVPVIPVPHGQLGIQELPNSSNGIVLTDISSSTWTSTQELLDLDRKPAVTMQTDSHSHFPITSADHHHPGQQRPPTVHHHPNHRQQHHQNHSHTQLYDPHPVHSHPYENNGHTKTQELTIVTSNCDSRTPTIGAGTASGAAGGGGAGGNGAVNSGTRRVLPAATPETPEDIEDKNLSWLFNFKLEDLPHLSPEAKRKQGPRNVGSGHSGNAAASSSAAQVGITDLEHRPDSVTVGGGGAIEEDDINVAENVTIENTATKITKKPPFTYTELIEYALEDKGELTVSGIYQWISDHFPFYKSNDDRWKNSVRHNLSINPHFRKGNKAPQGAGHLWTISSRDSEANFLAWEHKRQRLELFFKMEAANNKSSREPPPGSPSQEEIAAATASLAQYEPHSPGHGSISESIDFRNPQPGPSSLHHPLGQQSMYANNQFEVVQSEELKRSAGEILNGIRRNVEVQIVHPISSNNFQAYALLDSDYYLADYLNPVSKEEIVQECGLRSVAGHRPDAAPGADYYITTIDPIELGINMSSGQDEDQILFEDDFNLNYFGNNIMT